MIKNWTIDIADKNPTNWAAVLVSFLLLAMRKYYEKSNLRGKKRRVYFSSWLQLTVCHCMEVRVTRM